MQLVLIDTRLNLSQSNIVLLSTAVCQQQDAV